MKRKVKPNQIEKEIVSEAPTDTPIGYTKQEIFTLVSCHARIQGERSTLDNYETSQCLYRGPDDRKCFIGVLIPDELYSKALEGPLEQLPAKLASKSPQLANMIESNMGFLTKLQGIHDCCGPADWEAELRELGRRHSLEYPD